MPTLAAVWRRLPHAAGTGRLLELSSSPGSGVGEVKTVRLHASVMPKCEATTQNSSERIGGLSIHSMRMTASEVPPQLVVVGESEGWGVNHPRPPPRVDRGD